MLFNSPEFVVLFLPCTLLVFLQLSKRGHHRLAIAWLFAASLLFYSWWNPANLPILIGSILFNYSIGSCLTRSSISERSKKFFLTLGIVFNLALIGYFKYTNFFVNTTNQVLKTNLYLNEIILPLGISFFTFQQIAYLIDVYKEQPESRYNLLDYCLFVAFFPQLIAGPLLHHKETISQFKNKFIGRLHAERLAIGITFFALGLFKKVILADTVAIYATQVFDTAADGVSLTLIEAWVGAIAYSLQLYFDFSGYCDMAIGIAKLFGIELPINFNSPYKATSIIDFWRRWHITLSNYLRDYLYIPLGGSRNGEVRRNINLMVTMLVCGLWHGAGWTFVIWGGLHGVYLLINHQWRSLRQTVLGHDLTQSSWWSRSMGWLFTFLAVVAGWVVFRAETMDIAVSILKGMAGFHGISLPHSLSSDLAFLQDWGVQFNDLMPNLAIEVEQFEDVNEIQPARVIGVVAGLLFIAVFLPNTQEWIEQHRLALKPSFLPSHTPNAHPQQPIKPKTWNLYWQPTQFWAVASAILTAIALLNLAKVSEFLYFEF